MNKDIRPGYCILAFTLVIDAIASWLLITDNAHPNATTVPQFVLWFIIGVASCLCLVTVYYLFLLHRLAEHNLEVITPVWRPAREAEWQPVLEIYDGKNLNQYLGVKK